MSTPAPQGGQLGTEADAAVEGGDAATPGAGQRGQLPLDLGGQLAGGDQDQALGPAGLGLADQGDEGDAEGEGLAGAGRGAAADVAPGEGVGQGGGLDGEGLGDASVGEALGDLGGDAEVEEGGGHVKTP